jgi:polyisoprenoid-binding protein YceI
MKPSATNASPRPSEARALFGTTSSTWRVDETESVTRFTAATLWGRATVTGHLGKTGGTLEWDGAAGRGQLTIATAGLSSGNRLRDHHLRSSDFFAIAEHPELTFEASEVVVERGDVQVRGELLIRGARHPLACAATATPLGPDRIALDATVALDLDELGISRGFLRMIPADVTADVRVVMRRTVA